MNEPIRDHINAISSRPASEAGRLASRLLRAAWPAGVGDRTEPGALEWVRRWRPARAEMTLPTCSCPAARCVLCN